MIEFKTKDEEGTAKELLKGGVNTPFWQLLVRALEESKIDIQAKQDSVELSELSAVEYKLENELFRSKKAFIDSLIKTPENLLSWLEEPPNNRKNFDPYDTAEDLH